MAKLYASLERAEMGRTTGLASNEKLVVHLSQNSKEVVYLTFVDGYIELWTKDDTGDHYWNREIVLKGKITGKKCAYCGEMTEKPHYHTIDELTK